LAISYFGIRLYKKDNNNKIENPLIVNNMRKILRPSFVRKDERGVFWQVINGKGRWSVLNIGKMKKNSIMGRHFHKKTDVFFFLIKGKAQIDMIDVQNRKRSRLILNAFEGLILKKGTQHVIKYLTTSEFIMLKSRRYSSKDRDTYSLA
jgi:dTDP-4-dehydrorhamnose 3,5-epimerase-like enzyme